MGTIDRARIDTLVSFNSWDKKDYNIKLLENCFEGINKMEWYLQSLRKILAHSMSNSYLRHSFFDVLTEMIQVCDLEDLKEVRERCMRQSMSNNGITQFLENEVKLSDQITHTQQNQLFNGKGFISFSLEIYRLINARLNAASRAEEQYGEISIKEAQLMNHLDIKKNPELASRKELHSEVVLKDSWVLISESFQMINDIGDKSIKLELKHTLDQATKVAADELEKVSYYLGDHISLIIQAKSTKQLPYRVRIHVKKMLYVFSKIFEAKLLMLNHITRSKGVGDGKFRDFADNVKLTLMYALHTLPHERSFTSKVKAKTEDRMRVFFLYFNLLHDIPPYDEGVTFSKQSQLVLHYIPEIKGKKVSQILTMLDEITCSPRFNDTIADRFFDFIFLDIDSWISRRVKVEQDLKACNAVKRWVLHSKLKMSLNETLSGFESLQKGLKNYIDTERDPFIPMSLEHALAEVIFILSQLLGRGEDFLEAFGHDSYASFRRKCKDPRYIDLERYSDVLYNKEYPETEVLLQRTQCLFEDFIDVMKVAQKFKENSDDTRFEKAIKQGLAEVNFPGTVMEAMLNEPVRNAIMKLPFIKNQSWTRNKIIKIIALCEALAKCIGFQEN